MSGKAALFSSTTTKVMTEPIHVVGAGSIGLLFASSIRTAFPNYPVRLLMRQKQQTVKDNNNFNVQVSLLSKQTNRPRVVSIPAQVIRNPNSLGTNEQEHSIRNLLLTTKAPDAAKAVESVLHRFDSQSTGKIIILSNGALAIREELKDLLHRASLEASVKLVLASTTHGAYREESDNDDLLHVVHAGVGKTFIEEEPRMSQLWDCSGLNATSISTEQATINMWHKLAANCVVNPITAMLYLKNGELLKPTFMTLIQNVMDEVSRVALAETGKVSKELEFTAISKFVHQVICDTAENQSSMMQDVKRKRPTEIQYLNGYIVNAGRKHGIPTPANSLLCKKIQQTTRNYAN